MKLITTEEHYISRAVNEQYMKVMTKLVSPAIRARLEGLQQFLESNKENSDLGELRLAAMDKQGVDIQVISYGNNSPMDLPPESAVLLCRQANVELAAAIQKTLTRFAVFTVLPVGPPQAAEELTRAVKELGFVGTSLNRVYRGRFLMNQNTFQLLKRRHS